MASLPLAACNMAADRTRGAKLIGLGAPLLTGWDYAIGLQQTGKEPAATQARREVA
jgi:hypothetical protein